MSDIDNTELAGLAAQAGLLDGEVSANGSEAMVQQAEADQQMQQQNQNTGQVRLILALAVPVLGKLYPCIEDIYTDPTCEQISAVIGPVLTKYGINLGDLGGKWGEEIAAIMVCGPIAFATYKGILADIASRAPVPKAVASSQPVRVEKQPETVSLG